MTTIVKGHGADTDGEETFVPDGVTVRMYTAANVDLDSDIALLALLDKAGDPGNEITGDILNYTLYTQDDEFIAQWYALAGDSGVPIWWVGTDIPDETRLCNDPNRNGDDPEAVTCRGLGVHNCTGVLGLLAGHSDIAIVACRGSDVTGTPEGGHTDTAYDAGSQEVSDLVDEFVAKLGSGDEAQVAQAEADADALPQEKVAMLINFLDYADWQRARWLKEYAKANDYEQFFGQLTSNASQLDGMMEWVGKIGSYGTAVDATAAAYPETFAQWFNQASEPVQDVLRDRPAIASVLAAIPNLEGVAELFDEGQKS